ncbi:MAG: ankyrin repeat domain-containing protein [Planctomycetota bacterium]
MSDLDELIEAGNLEGIRSALDAGVSMDGRSPLGEDSALAEASTAGHVEIVRLLLERGAKPNSRKTYDIPLVTAAREGYLDIVDLLIHHGAKLDAREEGYVTALMEAAGFGHRAVVERLLEAGAKPRLEDDDQQSALVRAVDNGHDDIAGLLEPLSSPRQRQYARLQKQLAETAVPIEKWKLLDEAVRVQDFNEIKSLLSTGHDINQTSKNGLTVLMHAAGSGQYEMVEFLLNLGANPAHIDSGDRIPLFYAAMNGRGDVYNLLYPLTPTKLRGTSRRAREALISDDRWVEFKHREVSDYKWNEFWKAVKQQDRPAVQTLLSSGHDVNQVNARGDTVLHRAAGEASLEMVQYLIDLGADPGAVNARRDGPLSAAAFNNRREIYKLLHPLTPERLHPAASRARDSGMIAGKVPFPKHWNVD